MRLGVILAAVAGLAIAAWMVFAVGAGEVLRSVASVGWTGFAAICAYGLGMFLVLGMAWFTLMVDSGGPARFIWARLARDSAGDVLPFSQFGGMLIGARALVLHGIAAPKAFAAMTVDVTTELMAQIAFIIVGVGIFVVRLGARDSDLPLVAIAGVGLVLAGGIAFVVLQRKGAKFAESLADRFLPRALHHTRAFNRALETIYDSRTRLAASSTLHLAGWFGSAGFIWLAVRLIGGHLDLAGAIAVESILCALRSAAVIVPAALGVQEAGYTLLLPLFGLPPEAGLAVSLLKRAKEIAIGVPVLLLWQVLEGRNVLKAASLESAE